MDTGKGNFRGFIYTLNLSINPRPVPAICEAKPNELLYFAERRNIHLLKQSSFFVLDSIDQILLLNSLIAEY